MANAHFISVGYNYDSNDGEDLLLKVAEELRREWQLIEAEAVRVEGPMDDPDGEPLAQYARYLGLNVDGSFRVIPNDDGKQIMLMSSGGDPSRKMKEAVRRAFIRLLLERMHKLGVNVNISVA